LAVAGTGGNLVEEDGLANAAEPMPNRSSFGVTEFGSLQGHIDERQVLIAAGQLWRAHPSARLVGIPERIHKTS